MQDSLRFFSLEALGYIELKELGRFRQKTINQRMRLKIQLTSYVDQIFPGLQYFFKSGLHSVIMTIPGIGFMNGRMILGEVGDIHRFPILNNLLAFAGLDPIVYQSGNFRRFSAMHSGMQFMML